MKVISDKQLRAHFNFYWILLLSSPFLFSCNSNNKSGRKEKPKTFTKTLKNEWKTVDTAGGKKLKNISEYVHFLYQQHENKPFWLAKGQPNETSRKLLAELDSIKYDGIDPERYHLKVLKQLYASFKDTTYTQIQLAFDTTLSNAYLQASRDLLMGTVNPKDADSLWYHVNDSSWNGLTLLANVDGKFIPLDSFRSKMIAYKMLRNEYRFYYNLQQDSNLQVALQHIKAWDVSKQPDSITHASIRYVIKKELPWVHEHSFYRLVKAYQYYMNVNVSGRVDSFTQVRLSRTPHDMMIALGTNMERMRWMQQDVGNLYIVVDVPLMELFFRNNDTMAMHMNTVVGKLARQTPSLYATMANVVINPPWGVPPTIMKKDVLPGILRSREKYLEKKDLTIYNRHGKVVDPDKINRKNYKNYIVKQAPGDDNALGYVKFNLPNKWDIYLHDTPHRNDFGRRNRFLSSGCVRLQKPLDMAIYILADLEKRRYTPERLDSVIDTHKTRWEILKTKIPVHIVYLTTFMDSTYTHVRFARDIYHRDSSLQAQIKMSAE